MDKREFKKNFTGVGDVEFKIAATRAELLGAFALIYREYLLRGYILPQHYRAGLRITLFNLHPETIVFIAMRDGAIVATCSLIPDSILGLPMDMAYKLEGDSLREQKRKLCEGAYLSIDNELFGSKMFSLFNVAKLDFLLSLFKMVFQYAVRYSEYDDLCIVTDPKYAIFQFLPFDTFGGVKCYGYDRVWLKRKAAVLKRFDIRQVRMSLNGSGFAFAKRMALDRLLVKDELPPEVFKRSERLSHEDLRFFFFEKSDLLGSVQGEARKMIWAWYGLGEKDLEAWPEAPAGDPPLPTDRRRGGRRDG